MAVNSGLSRGITRLAIVLFVVAIAIGTWFGYRAWVEHQVRKQIASIREMLERREWSAARRELDEFISSRPENATAHLLAARANRRMERLDEAKKHIESAETLTGGETRDSKIERALLKLRRDDLIGVEAFLRECLQSDDENTGEILDLLSIALINDQRVAEAQSLLDELVKRRPNDFEALVRRGKTAEALGWAEIVVESLTKAVELRGSDFEVRLALAQSLVTAGKYVEAIDHLEKLRQREPNNPAVKFVMARCLAWKGQKSEAQKILDDLLASDPNNWSVLSERGSLALELDRPAEAEGFLRRARSTAPPNQALSMRLADALRLLDKNDEARQYRDEAEQLRIALRRVAELTQQIRDDRPDRPDKYHELAAAFRQLGRDEAAVHFFKKALEKDAKHRPSHEALAALYSKLGAPDRAAMHRRELDSKP